MTFVLTQTLHPTEDELRKIIEDNWLTLPFGEEPEFNEDLAARISLESVFEDLIAYAKARGWRIRPYGNIGVDLHQVAVEEYGEYEDPYADTPLDDGWTLIEAGGQD